MSCISLILHLKRPSQRWRVRVGLRFALYSDLGFGHELGFGLSLREHIGGSDMSRSVALGLRLR